MANLNAKTVLRGPSVAGASIPAPGSWLALGTDSNGDRSNDNRSLYNGITAQAGVRYGAVVDDICAHFGWNVLNENYIINGSFEGAFAPALSGVDSPSGFFNCATQTDTNAATLVSGSQSMRILANATTTGMYAIVGGAAPCLLTMPAPVGGALTSAPTIFSAGRGMVAPKLNISGGTGASLSVQVYQGAFLAVRVDAGGTGYLAGGTGTSTSIVTVDAPSCTDAIGLHGSGAVFTATVTAGVITSVAVTVPGGGYPDTPTWIGVPSNGVGTVSPSGPIYVNGSGQATATTLGSGGAGLTATPNPTVQHVGPRYRNDASGNIAFPLGLPVLQPGETWTLFGWLTGSGITGGNCYLQIVGSAPGTSNGARQAFATAATSGIPAGATKVSATFTVPAGFGSMEIRLGTTGAITNGSSLVWLDGLSLIRGSATPSAYCDYLTQRGGYASQTFSSAPGGFNLTGSIFSRVTQFAQANVALLWHFINDIGSASGAVAVGNRVTVAALSANLDTVLAAINAMASHPLVVVVGLPPWAATTWNASLPPGYASYDAFASDVELLIQRKCVQYGAIYVPIRRHMDQQALLIGAQANQVHISPWASKQLAEIIIGYIEGRLY